MGKANHEIILADLAELADDAPKDLRSPLQTILANHAHFKRELARAPPEHKQFYRSLVRDASSLQKLCDALRTYEQIAQDYASYREYLLQVRDRLQE